MSNGWSAATAACLRWWAHLRQQSPDVVLVRDREFIMGGAEPETLGRIYEFERCGRALQLEAVPTVSTGRSVFVPKVGRIMSAMVGG